jgi:FkbM family methyltransferase
MMSRRSLTSRSRQQLKRFLGTLPAPVREVIYPTGLHVRDLNGVKLMLDFSAPLHRIIHRQGGFEPELTAALCMMLQPEEVFVDIGANIGWHTLSLLVRRPDVRISYAYEPSAKSMSLLNAGIAANRCQNRCVAKQLALGAHQGKARLKMFYGLDAMHASMHPLGDCSYQEEEVELDTLDAQAETFVAPAAVIKCDVEGSEREVLQGAKGVLSGQFGPPPVWLLEVNYETAGMAGYFPWQLIDIAAAQASYAGYYLREGRIRPLPGKTSLRHGDTLILALPELHGERLARVTLNG